MILLNQDLNAQATGSETFTVTHVPAENGAYTIQPAIADATRVKAGTVLTVIAKPSPKYSLDAIYYTVKGGMWGTTSYESFSSPMIIRVDKDMSIGATFVERELVENLNLTQDVVYAKPGNKALKYDVFSPKGARNLPCIVIVHGGGWSSNNEDIMRGLAREVAKGGKYVVFSIDYRWVNKLDGDEKPNYMHNLIEDVFGAIAHIQEHAATYGGDPKRIAVTGDSAGGHLSESAALLSPLIGDGGFGARAGVYEYLPSYMPKGKSLDQVRQEIMDAVKAVAPSYGPSDARHFKMFIEQTSDEYYDAVSPVKHVPQVRQRALPHFIVRGKKDDLVTHAVVQSYVDVLKSAGQRVEYIQVDDAGHAFFDWKPDAATRATFAKYGIKYAAEMQAFFDTVFK
ncbi:alpha/beta hydrolase [Flavihumibacter sp. ZG627]|uniref:alpha/beta hydrolase n=1 Tax=Flavihumibacter sp. ZG627 TaxID=1463156 RepID=UPI000693E42F|nr:alpha/beta hydrolase [Flavihumibacter sp. ZG627]